MAKNLGISVDLKLIDKLTAPAKKARAALGGTGAALDKLQANLKNTKAAEKSLKAFKKQTEQAKKNQATIKTLNETLRTKGKLTGAQNTKLKTANALSKKYTKELKAQAQSLKKVGLSTKNIAGSEAKLRAGREKAIKQISRLNMQTKKLARLRKQAGKAGKILGVAGGVVGVAGIYRLGSALQSTATDLDVMAKAAKNLKIPLDQFQALRHQAELAGVDNARFTKSYATFNKNLGELKTKTSSLFSTALKDFKPELLADLKDSKDSLEAYEMILKTIQEIPDASKQAALANAAFGRDGKNLLILLREGTDGLAKAKKELAALGGGATQEDVQVAQDFNDQLTRLKQGFNVIKFSTFTPVLKELIALFEGIIVKMKDPVWRDGITDKLKDGFKTAMSVIKSIGAVFVKISPALKFLADNLGTVTAAFVALKIAMLGIPILAIIAGIALIATAIYENWGSIKSFVGGIWGGIKRIFYLGIAGLIKSLKRLTKFIPDKFLPDSMTAAGLDKSIAKYSELAKNIKKNQAILPTKLESQQIIRNEPAAGKKSTVDVRVKIDSQLPARVEEAKANGAAELALDVGNISLAY